jgi:branched-chain amino acid transport system ATP-binding protein
MVTPLNQDHALTLSGVSKVFGGLRAVDGVSLHVGPGERRAIIGPNGAGKTTLFNLISGEMPLSAGRILLFGRDVTHLAPHRRAGLGLSRTFQITNLFANLTVLENILLAAQALHPAKLSMLRPLSAYPHFYAEARRLLDAVGLGEKEGVLVRNLSHGEQRQVEVTLALTGRPRLLLLDEPTAGLSPAESQAMADLLKKLDPEITILMIEHDMGVAFDFAEVITVLHQGQVIAEGKREEIKENGRVQEIYLGA